MIDDELKRVLRDIAIGTGIAAAFLAVMFGLVTYRPGPPIGLPLPAIAGRHWVRSWIGATLYQDVNGVEAASFIEAGSSSAQACIFDLPGPCAYFEENRQALLWIAARYAAAAREQP